MGIRHPKDFASGLMFLAFGIAAIVLAASYPLGTAARMGPGYFPRILGILMIVFGIALALRSFRLQGSAFELGNPMPALVVLAAVVLFGVLVPTMGLVVTTIMLILLSSSASSEFRWKEALISGIVLATVSVLGFVKALGLQFAVWPTFLVKG